jgi:predicted dienelactone hydrolase
MNNKPYDPCQRGPLPVGVKEFVMEDASRGGRKLEVSVWYPATDSFRGKDLDPETQAKKPLAVGNFKGKATQAAVLEAEPRDESAPYPLLVFSHGNAGFRFQSTFFTTHLASHGYMVAAPDHTGNTFFEFFRLRKAEDVINNIMESARNRPADISFIMDQLLDAGAEAGGIFSSLIDKERIGLSGHSFGGWTTLVTPGRDDRIKLLLPMAPPPELGLPIFAYEDKEFERKRDIPTLLMAAEKDSLINYEQLGKLFDKIPDPKQMLTLKNADHFHFCDDVGIIHNLFYFEIMGRLSARGRENAVILPSTEPLPVEKLLEPKTSENAINGAGLAFLDLILRDKPEAKKWLFEKSITKRLGKDVRIEP